MRDFTDDPRPVRPGEQLDRERLLAFLGEKLPRATAGAELVVEQFPGGHSNLTYLVRLGTEEYVLRRPPFGSRVATAHDMGREYRVLSRLSAAFPEAPTTVLYCDDEAVLGAPFYLMRRVRGIIVRRDPADGMYIDESTARRMSETLVDTLARLHAVDYDAAGLGELGKPAGYVRRQVEGWSRRYERSQTDDVPSVTGCARWLLEHLPEDGTPALIHNDFKFDNVVLDAGDITRIVGILDWEMCTLGDPLMDLGTTLSYWVQNTDPPMLHEIRFGPTHLPGMLTRAQVAERYAGASGRDISNIVYYYAYGLFKTAVVAQQIYYRYKQGFTDDARFEKMIVGVKVLSQYALAVIARGHL